jgi:hypothetical protein
MHRSPPSNATLDSSNPWFYNACRGGRNRRFDAPVGLHRMHSSLSVHHRGRLLDTVEATPLISRGAIGSVGYREIHGAMLA